MAGKRRRRLAERRRYAQSADSGDPPKPEYGYMGHIYYVMSSTQPYVNTGAAATANTTEYSTSATLINQRQILIPVVAGVFGFPILAIILVCFFRLKMHFIHSRERKLQLRQSHNSLHGSLHSSEQGLATTGVDVGSPALMIKDIALDNDSLTPMVSDEATHNEPTTTTGFFRDRETAADRHYSMALEYRDALTCEFSPKTIESAIVTDEIVSPSDESLIMLHSLSSVSSKTTSKSPLQSTSEETTVVLDDLVSPTIECETVFSKDLHQNLPHKATSYGSLERSRTRDESKARHRVADLRYGSRDSMQRGNSLKTRDENRNRRQRKTHSMKDVSTSQHCVDRQQRRQALRKAYVPQHHQIRHMSDSAQEMVDLSGSSSSYIGPREMQSESVRTLDA